MNGEPRYEITVEFSRSRSALSAFLYPFILSRNWLVSVVVIALLTAFIIWVESDGDEGEAEISPAETVLILSLSTAFVGLCAGIGQVTKVLFAAKRDFQPMKYSFGEDGVIIEGKHHRWDFNWPYFQDVKIGKRSCVLRVDEEEAYTIPKRSFPADQDWDRFCAFCSGQFQLAKAHAEQ